ncbi:hypothetical protein [Scopulibacillus daqui]|uniref:hypothetical protein n=1 Tax=Scopulibacillus daqui TaxID=1469162 RepID=UPI001961CE3F|nr:hypothetical protein [Scopulibacillus daqui]
MIIIKEPVGKCIDCNKTVYCEGGFLQGVVLENHRIRCYDCQNEKEIESAWSKIKKTD